MTWNAHGMGPQRQGAVPCQCIDGPASTAGAPAGVERSSKVGGSGQGMGSQPCSAHPPSESSRCCAGGAWRSEGHEAGKGSEGNGIEWSVSDGQPSHPNI